MACYIGHVLGLLFLSPSVGAFYSCSLKAELMGKKLFSPPARSRPSFLGVTSPLSFAEIKDQKNVGVSDIFLDFFVQVFVTFVLHGREVSGGS